MPQQLPVVQLLVGTEPLSLDSQLHHHYVTRENPYLSLSVDSEHVQELHFSPGSSGLDVLVDYLILVLLFLDVAQLGLQTLVVDVQRVGDFPCHLQ